MNDTDLRPEIMVYYKDTVSGQAYVEIGGRTYELEVGNDVTEDVPFMELEAMAVHDPSSVDEEPGTLRVDSFE